MTASLGAFRVTVLQFFQQGQQADWKTRTSQHDANPDVAEYERSSPKETNLNARSKLDFSTMPRPFNQRAQRLAGGARETATE